MKLPSEIVPLGAFVLIGVVIVFGNPDKSEMLYGIGGAAVGGYFGLKKDSDSN